MNHSHNIKKISILFFFLISFLSFHAQIQLKKDSYFDYIGPYRKGFAAVANNGFGFINSRLQLIVPCIYEDYWCHDLGAPFTNGRATVKKNGKWGVIDTLNHTIVDFEYDWITAYDSYNSLVVCKNKLQALVDINGNPITPFVYNGIWYVRNGLRKVTKDKTIGYLDIRGKEVIPCIYEDGSEMSKEGLLAVKLNKKWGFIDSQATVKIPFDYDFATGFSEGLAVVGKGDSAGFIDVTGKLIIPMIYNSNLYYEFKKNNCALVKKGMKWGAINKSGKVIIPFEYTDWIVTCDPWIQIRQNKKDLLFDTTGKQIIDSLYEHIYLEENGNLKVYNDNKYGIINTKGEVIIPVMYDELIWGDQGLYYAAMNEKSGYLDANGKEVIPMKYDFVNRLGPDIWSGKFDEPYVFESLNGINRLIDRKDSCVLGCLTDTIFIARTENSFTGFSGEIKNGFREGVWSYFYQNGKIRQELNYMHGKIDGTIKTWAENGILIKLEIYKDGKFEKSESYDKETGKLVNGYDSNYITNSLGSTFVNTKFENGKIERKGNIKKYYKEGLWQEGKLDSLDNYILGKGNYQYNRKIGVWKYFNQNDSLLFTEKYKKEGQLQKNGVHTIFLPYDKAYTKGYSKKGKKEGVWLTYTFDGKCIRKENYNKDVLVGEAVEYYRNGLIKTIGKYQLIKIAPAPNFIKMGFTIVNQHMGDKGLNYFISKPYGKWTHYHDNGKLRLEENFELKEMTPSDTLFIWQNNEPIYESMESFLEYQYLPSQNKTGIETEYDEYGNIISVGSYFPVPVCHSFWEQSEQEDDPNNPGTFISISSKSQKLEYLKHGIWKYYDKNGTLLKEELYDKGKLK